MSEREPELIETRDYEGVARAASYETLILAAAEHFQMIWNRVLSPGDRIHRTGRAEREADQAAAEGTFALFIDGIYDRLADLTKEQAQREIGAVAAIVNSLKRGQRLRDAMTRDQFRARYIALTKTKASR